jgi:hypothetical protein
MSTLLYAAATRQRSADQAREAPTAASRYAAAVGLSPAPAEGATAKSYVATLAALVPAEVLALHAFMLEATTTTKAWGSPAAQRAISAPAALRATFWVCLGLAPLIYVAGRAGPNSGGRRWVIWDVLRAAVPAAAFTLWVILQKSTAWDAVSPDSLSEGSRALVGAAGAIVLGVVATMLSLPDDKKRNGGSSGGGATDA